MPKEQKSVRQTSQMQAMPFDGTEKSESTSSKTATCFEGRRAQHWSMHFMPAPVPTVIPWHVLSIATGLKVLS